MRFLFIVTVGLLASASSWAGPACTYIADAATGKALVEEGDCTARESPASTFKVALSLMGYDRGVLVDAHTPAWPYKEEYKAMMESWRITVDPTIWMEDSVVWYSQVLTRQMGEARFKAYVAGFGYGNGDASGDAGKNNGLTNAWLMSSLQISPREQVDFLRRMRAGTLPVSQAALAGALAIMPTFPADDGWELTGKTGSGLLRSADGKLDRNRQFGWFVGWATKGPRTVVFARLVRDDEKTDDRAGVRARGDFVTAFPALMSGR